MAADVTNGRMGMMQNDILAVTVMMPLHNFTPLVMDVRGQKSAFAMRSMYASLVSSNRCISLFVTDL